MNFVKYVDDSTSKYLNQITKIERKKIGQFFTNSQTAAYMGSLIKKEQGVPVQLVSFPPQGSSHGQAGNRLLFVLLTVQVSPCLALLAARHGLT